MALRDDKFRITFGCSQETAILSYSEFQERLLQYTKLSRALHVYIGRVGSKHSYLMSLSSFNNGKPPRSEEENNRLVGDIIRMIHFDDLSLPACWK